MMKTLTAGRVGLPLLSPSPLPQLAATERDLGKSRGEAEARAAEAVRMDNIQGGAVSPEMLRPHVL